jgi:DNA replication protein DnaC
MHAVVDKGENVFITGSAGTGKSFLVAHLLEMLVAKHALVRWLQRPLRLACSQEV